MHRSSSPYATAPPELKSAAPTLVQERFLRYRRAVDYLAAAQIYLRDNPLLRESLRPEHIKDRLLGHRARHQHDLRPPEPARDRAGRESAPGHGTRARGRREHGESLAGGNARRVLPRALARRGGAPRAVPRVLLAVRIPQ